MLEISGGGIPTQRLGGASGSVEITVAANASGALPVLARTGAQDRAALEQLPLVDGNPLGGLLSALSLADLAGTAGKLAGPAGSPGQPAVPELDQLPALGPILAVSPVAALPAAWARS